VAPDPASAAGGAMFAAILALCYAGVCALANRRLLSALRARRAEGVR
jgi:hypothetical protein